MSARTAAHPRVPSATLHGAKTDSRYGNQPSLRPALPLYPDAQKAVEHCRHSLSKEALSPSHCSQSGRSDTAQPPPAGWVTSLLSNTSARPLIYFRLWGVKTDHEESIARSCNRTRSRVFCLFTDKRRPSKEESTGWYLGADNDYQRKQDEQRSRNPRGNRQFCRRVSR